MSCLNVTTEMVDWKMRSRRSRGDVVKHKVMWRAFQGRVLRVGR